MSVVLFKAAYDEGRSALDQQYSALNSIRQRSVQFMAFVGSATAFLVGSAVTASPDRTCAFYAAMTIATALSLASIGFLSLILLSVAKKRAIGTKESTDPAGQSATKPPDITPGKWGRAEWNFSVDPKVLIEDWIDPKVGAANESNFYRGLALHSQVQLDENDFYLTQIYNWYRRFVVSATLQVIAWTVAVWMFV